MRIFSIASDGISYATWSNFFRRTAEEPFSTFFSLRVGLLLRQLLPAIEGSERSRVGAYAGDPSCASRSKVMWILSMYSASTECVFCVFC